MTAASKMSRKATASFCFTSVSRRFANPNTTTTTTTKNDDDDNDETNAMRKKKTRASDVNHEIKDG